MAGQPVDVPTRSDATQPGENRSIWQRIKAAYLREN